MEKDRARQELRALLAEPAAGFAALSDHEFFAALKQACQAGTANLCVPRTLSTSCDQAIFVDHASDPSVFPDVVSLKIDRFG